MALSNPPISSSQSGSEATTDTFWTFALVEEALIEAMLLWRRAPDRERGWLTVKAFWPEIRRHTWFGDYADDEAEPRPLPLSRAQVAEMERVGEWLGMVAERDRKLVVLAILALASGKARVPWSRLLRPMGMKSGAGALAQRYERAIGVLAFRLNGRSEADALRLVQRRGEGWQAVIGAEAISRAGLSH
jgi:hypothetical protein